jgi:hypothetical protein
LYGKVNCSLSNVHLCFLLDCGFQKWAAEQLICHSTACCSCSCIVLQCIVPYCNVLFSTVHCTVLQYTCTELHCRPLCKALSYLLYYVRSSLQCYSPYLVVQCDAVHTCNANPALYRQHTQHIPSPVRPIHAFNITPT